MAFGDPLLPWPGWYQYPGIWGGGPFLSFGAPYGIGFFGGYGWGWPHWGFDWHNRYAIYNYNRYYSRSRTFYNRNYFYRGPGGRGGVYGGRGEVHGGRGGVYNRPGATPRPFGGDPRAARGYAEPHGQSGVRSGAFSGYDHGGQTRGYASRGSSNMGGGARGGASHAGGGAHGGGGGRR